MPRRAGVKLRHRRGGGRGCAALVQTGSPRTQLSGSIDEPALPSRPGIILATARRVGELAAGELQDQCLVERRDRRDLETVEAFHRREPCLLDAALDHPSFPVDQFKFGQAQQVTRVVEALGDALLGDLVVFVDERARGLRRSPHLAVTPRSAPQAWFW
jgi:hypothetical protein